MGWISVKDELPKVKSYVHAIDVLAFCRRNELTTFQCVREFSQKDGFKDKSVTHWQYLPEDPEEQ